MIWMLRQNETQGNLRPLCFHKYIEIECCAQRGSKNHSQSTKNHLHTHKQWHKEHGTKDLHGSTYCLHPHGPKIKPLIQS